MMYAPIWVSRFEALSEQHIFDAGLDVFELRVECHGDGRLPRSEVSGKVRPVIDRRVGRS